MKKAFTMIELIFVIVILGILASVAISKLSATRDDAKIASMAQQIKVSMSEIFGTSFATGVIKKPQEMSHVLKQLMEQGKAKETLVSPITGSVGQLTIYTQNGGNVDDHTFILDINLTTLVVSYGTPCNGVICKQLQKRVSEGNFSVGGERVVF